ncbi:MAG: Glu/Leu/Phe/Val dehydrogenase, partial [Nitrospina sp.]|nr:Glu/Leu/Phe/Val dehydrogenase [Nitrospina sp.]
MSAHYIDSFADDLGPEKIVHIYEPESGLKAIVVIDNLSLGPAVGGCRMASDVSTREVFRLARAMTLKNALNNLPHGGAKSAILEDPAVSNKEALVREFARAIKNLPDYIPGPDMGTDETCMAYIHDEIGRAVGLPKALGGLPLDELGTTGYGLAVAADVASEVLGMSLENARVIIQGFGNVGKAVARFLTERGAIIIATCDKAGAIHDPEGINIPALIEFKNSGRCVQDSGLGESLRHEEMLQMESDIFIPSARPDVFSVDNQHWLKTKLVLEGANIPITHDAAEIMVDRGIVIVPDVIANGGGVICAATEYQGMNEKQAFERIESTISQNTREVLERTLKQGHYPHSAS